MLRQWLDKNKNHRRRRNPHLVNGFILKIFNRPLPKEEFTAILKSQQLDVAERNNAFNPSKPSRNIEKNKKTKTQVKNSMRHMGQIFGWKDPWRNPWVCNKFPIIKTLRGLMRKSYSENQKWYYCFEKKKRKNNKNNIKVYVGCL